MSNLHDAKVRTEEFWDENPCGSGSTWERAKELRFKVTDSYLLDFLKGPTLRGKNVLEVGCGQGFDASIIVERCKSYVGIDLSAESLEIAQREVNQRRPHNVSVRFLQGDAEKLGFPENSFDAAYSIGVLHHTANFDTALNEINRILQPNGKFILMLYRSFTPLWIVLRVVRGFFRIPIIGPKLRIKALRAVRKRNREQQKESISGTAILELIGCPIIDTYTYRGLRKKLGQDYEFNSVTFHRTGIDQVIRVLPMWLRKNWPQPYIESLDSRLSHWFGFYLFTIATRRSIND